MTRREVERLARLAQQFYLGLPASRPLMVAVSGSPGTGKSTLAHAVAAASSDALVVSLDDYYYGRSRRDELARDVHPLFSRRGVPGTHDFALFTEHLRWLQGGAHQGFSMPRFDKARDDVSDECLVIPPGRRPRLLLVEGWILGFPAQTEQALADPANELESLHDPDRVWRQAVNQYLARYHEALNPLIQVHWHLRAPSWESVIDWRWDQERNMPRPWLTSREEVRTFLSTFQRLCAHADQFAAHHADGVILLDHSHRPAVEKIP